MSSTTKMGASADPIGKLGEEINHYGERFKWTSLHQTPAQLKHLQKTYDSLSQAALNKLDELLPVAPIPARPAPSADNKTTPTREARERPPQRDAFRLLRQHASDAPEIRAFWDEVDTVPEWVNWEQIERGQKVFWRYAGASITSLTYLSLLGGMAGGRIVETLDRTGGFSASVVRRRLLETTQHTFAVHKDLESLQPGGQGWESSVRVRLLHTSVRRRIMALAAQKPEYYDVASFGIPINDLDCIGTINTFSAATVYMGLPRQGIVLRRQEELDYLAVWRYVAYLMGTPHDWLASPAEAKAMMQSLIVSEIRPTGKSGNLANNIVFGFEGIPPIYASRGFLYAQVWWLNGGPLSRALNIPKPSLFSTVLVAMQCWLFMVNGYLTRSIPWLDEMNVKNMRAMFYELLVDNKQKGALGYKAMFTFKWVPDLLNPTTPLGVADDDRMRDSGPWRRNGIERMLTLLLVLAAASGCGAAVLGARAARGSAWLAAARGYLLAGRMRASGAASASASASASAAR
ncbi:oxygenase MpaB family protein [Microdochium nivale]|nr:oxygenase MpaB family protein [Microdochium nivale]